MMIVSHAGEDRCFALDLKISQNDWKWNVDLIPRLRLKMNNFIMEYVKITKKIYVIGGRSGDLHLNNVNTLQQKLSFQ